MNDVKFTGFQTMADELVQFLFKKEIGDAFKRRIGRPPLARTTTQKLGQTINPCRDIFIVGVNDFDHARQGILL